MPDGITKHISMRARQLSNDAAREMRSALCGHSRWATIDEVAYLSALSDNIHNTGIKDEDVIFVITTNDPYGNAPVQVAIGRAIKELPVDNDDVETVYASMDLPDGTKWSHCADDFVCIISTRKSG